MKRIMVYLLTCLLVLVMNWEYQRSVAATMMNPVDAIPEESIRLRILAHSDAPRDQWLKREIRDEVVHQMTDWTAELESIEDARVKAQSSLAEIEELVHEVIEGRGFSYDFQVEYGQIDFPTKLYGNKLYPAGEYEGLLITVGSGQGDNWWCVLFPPLCFVDFGSEEKNQAEEVQLDENQAQAKQSNSTTSIEENEVEVRFFLVELFAKLKSAIMTLFA